MEQQSQENLESRIRQLEMATQGAQAELDEAGRLLREAETEKTRLESEMRHGADDPGLMHKYQTTLIEITRLTKERDQFAADREELRAELQALHDHQSEIGNINRPRGQA